MNIKLSALFIGTLTGLAFFPTALKMTTVRTFKYPMDIRSIKNSPPRQAFEQLFPVNTEKIAQTSKESINLNEEQLKTKNWNPLRQLFVKRIFLKPMLLSRAEIPKEDLLVAQAEEKIKTDIENVNFPASTVPQNIHGTIRLAPGLALGDRTLEIRRFEEGIPKEAGTINPETGTFSIDVASPRGAIEVELYDKNHAIVASGEYRLGQPESVPAFGANYTKGTPTTVYVSPRNQLAGNFNDFNKQVSRRTDKLFSDKRTSSRGEKADILFASLGVEQKSDELGSFAVPNMSASSWGIVRAKARGFEEALFLIPTGEGKSLPLMPAELISTLRSLSADITADDGSGNKSVVWGQVLYDGKPLAGVAVQAETDQDVAPIYMQGFIPVAEQKTTSENGFFVFMNLPAGMHSLLATRNGEYLGHVNIVVDDGAVSISTIEATTKKLSVPVKVYDALDGSAQEAKLEMQSLPEAKFVSGQAELQLQPIQRLSLVHVLPRMSDYMPTQMVYSDDAEYLHVPLISQAWLEHILAEQKINIIPNTGIVIGFVPEDDFEAYLPQAQDSQALSIVYFDYLGRPSEPGTSSGKMGGGFVMFNVPGAVQSVAIVSKKTEMVNTQVIPVDAGTTSVLKFHF